MRPDSYYREVPQPKRSDSPVLERVAGAVSVDALIAACILLATAWSWW